MANVRGILRRARRGRRDSSNAIVDGEQGLTHGLRASQQEHFIGPDDEGSDGGSPVRHATHSSPAHQYTPMDHHAQTDTARQYTSSTPTGFMPYTGNTSYDVGQSSNAGGPNLQTYQPLGFVPWASQSYTPPLGGSSQYSAQDTTLALAQGLCDEFFSSIPGGVQSTPLPASGGFLPPAYSTPTAWLRGASVTAGRLISDSASIHTA